MIPAAARADSENLSGARLIRMSLKVEGEDEHSSSSLGHSEPLRVQHAPLDKSVGTNRHAFRSPLLSGDRDFESCHLTNHESKVAAFVC